VTQQGRTEYLAVMRGRYRRASKPEKGRLLDEICRTARLHRKAVIRALQRTATEGQPRGGRPRRYGPELRPSLTRLWELSDRLCAGPRAHLTEQALALNPARLMPQLQATLTTLWKLAELPSGRTGEAVSPQLR